MLGKEPDDEPGDNFAPGEPGDNFAPSRVTTSAEPGDAVVTRYKKPSKNHQEPSDPPKPPRGGREGVAPWVLNGSPEAEPSATDPPPDPAELPAPTFDEIRTAYPGDCVSSHQAARTWRRLPDAEKCAALAGIPAYTASCSGKRQIRDLTGYLRGRCWRDVATITPGTYFDIRGGTPEAEAWEAFEQSQGRLVGYMRECWRLGKPWQARTQWPPGHLVKPHKRTAVDAGNDQIAATAVMVARAEAGLSVVTAADMFDGRISQEDYQRVVAHCAANREQLVAAPKATSLMGGTTGSAEMAERAVWQEWESTGRDNWEYDKARRAKQKAERERWAAEREAAETDRRAWREGYLASLRWDADARDGR